VQVNSTIQPSITVLSPNGGENFTVGVPFTIKWTSTNITGGISVDVLSTDLSRVLVSASLATDSGYYTFTPGVGTPTGQYIARVRATNASDSSDSPFNITASTGSLSVSLVPNPVSQTIASGSADMTFANYYFDATQSNEDIRVTSIPLKYSWTTGNAGDLTNCRLFDGSVVLNGVSNIVNPLGGVSGDNRTFALDQNFIVPKDTTKTLTLKCNVSASATGSYKWGISSSANINAVGINSLNNIQETITPSDGPVMTIGSSVGTVLSNSPILENIKAEVTNNQTFSITPANSSRFDWDLNGDGAVNSTDINITRMFASLSETDFQSVKTKVLGAILKRMCVPTNSVVCDPLLDFNGDGSILTNEAVMAGNAMDSTR